MTHRSEDSHPLTVEYTLIRSQEDLRTQTQGFPDVCMLVLSSYDKPGDYRNPLEGIGTLVAGVADNLGPDAVLVTLGEVVDLVQVQADMPASVRYQLWIAVERASPRVVGDSRALPCQHFGALVHTRYRQSLRHTKTRIAYTYCPICDKTTKDYGGKKHTYHEYGTLVSDVWRDTKCDLEGDISPVIARFADLFGIEPYRKLAVLDCRKLKLGRVPAAKASVGNTVCELSHDVVNSIRPGDCLERLRELPSNSVDFGFTDPPYNLGKTYIGYTDDLRIQDYFKWCDQWITEMARVLKPGRTLALLNIPLWSIRHFLFMRDILTFQNWIVWDALAFPVRMVMPAHYTILCFSKGTSRELPGLIGESGQTVALSAPETFRALEPLAEEYCLRPQCVRKRQLAGIDDHGPLIDIWSDIHRLKHNSRRVDHPCQLPPHLMYRLISIFTRPDEVILDCFNGAGTTTLAAHQLGRRYIGIELEQKYCDMASGRHGEIRKGLDPFRKTDRVLTAKNSPVPRMPKQVYEIPKKTLQLEVKRVAELLRRLPTREELIRMGRYPIRYYDDYFMSWGEVCAAARTTGMTEDRATQERGDASIRAEQLSFELDPG